MFGTKGLAAQPRQLHTPPMPPALERLRFDVTWKPGHSALAALFFAACGYVCWLKMFEPRGLIIDGIIRFGPVGASRFFALIMLVSLGMAAMGAFNFVRSFGERRWLSLDADAVRGPKGYNSRQEVRIAYRSITQARVRKVKRQEFVEIFGNGQAIKVAAGTFRTKDDFHRFVQELQARISGSTG